MKLFSKLSVKLQLTILCFLIATLSVGIFAAIIFTLSAAVVIQLAERNANQAIVFATKYLYTRIEDLNANMIAFQAKEALNHSLLHRVLYIKQPAAILKSNIDLSGITSYLDNITLAETGKVFLCYDSHIINKTKLKLGIQLTNNPTIFNDMFKSREAQTRTISIDSSALLVKSLPLSNIGMFLLSVVRIDEFSTEIENVNRETVIRKVTELKSLQAQITPRFLYNTLNSIIALSKTTE